MKINESKEHLVRFWSHLHDNQYIHDTCGFIQINYVRLTNNGYMVSIPLKNGYKVIFHMDI